MNTEHTQLIAWAGRRLLYTPESALWGASSPRQGS
jgi:hypothetical protein